MVIYYLFSEWKTTYGETVSKFFFQIEVREKSITKTVFLTDFTDRNSVTIEDWLSGRLLKIKTRLPL